MFLNIDEKLKSVAKAMAAFGVLAAIAGAVCFFTAKGMPDFTAYAGIFAGMIAGGFALFFGSFFAYGLGQLIENTSGNAVCVPSASTASSTASASSAVVSNAQPATTNASVEEATVVAIATAAIAASRGASACAFKVISITKIS